MSNPIINPSIVVLLLILKSVFSSVCARLVRLIFGAEVVVKSLQYLLAALIAVVHLNLLVLVADQFLHIHASLASHAQHNTALSGQLLCGNRRLLNLQFLFLLSLLGAHVVLGYDSSFELL